MPSRKLITLLLPFLLILTSCGTSATSQVAVENVGAIDILERLQTGGSFTWTEDPFNDPGSTAEHVYLSDQCAVWQFPSYDEVEAADKAGYFDFYKGEVWYGGDEVSGKGVALLTDSKTTDCAKYVFSILNWSTEESGDSTDSASMAGKWGSYSWMDDQVGAFLIVKSLGGSEYVGTFYTQGQSGGVFKDSTIQITDSGDGLAEVTWPTGTVNMATWGKRDANTPSDMDPSWNGDIWFDCIDELDFAQSRADCDFYYSGN